MSAVGDHLRADPIEHLASLAARVDAEREVFAHDLERDMFFYVWNRGGPDLHATRRVPTDCAVMFARRSAHVFLRALSMAETEGPPSHQIRWNRCEQQVGNGVGAKKPPFHVRVGDRRFAI